MVRHTALHPLGMSEGEERDGRARAGTKTGPAELWLCEGYLDARRKKLRLSAHNTRVSMPANVAKINPNTFTTRPEIEGTFGVVTTTHWIATAVGMAALEKGGNAFDAAVAVAFTLQV